MWKSLMGVVVVSGILGSATVSLAQELPDLGGITLTVGSDTAYPPFEFVDENNQVVGFDIDLLNAICDKVNCGIEVQSTGFDGIFAALAAGEFDLVASAVTITAERAEIVDFTRPYLNAGQIVTVPMGSDVTGPEDLMGLTVGVQLGTTGDLVASDLTEEGAIQRFETIDLAMVALAQGDLDAVVADGPTSAEIVNAQFSDRLMLVGDTFTTEFYGLAIRKETPEITAAFDAAIEALIEDGSLTEIAETWGLPAAAVADLPDSGLE
jgi:polar amino acid transport system substrate-binding protein